MKTESDSAALRSDRNQETLQLSKKDYGRIETLRFINTDKIVGVLGEFPELTKAVRDGDLATVSILCAQLFESQAGKSTTA